MLHVVDLSASSRLIGARRVRVQHFHSWKFTCQMSTLQQLIVRGTSILRPIGYFPCRLFSTSPLPPLPPK